MVVLIAALLTTGNFQGSPTQSETSVLTSMMQADYTTEQESLDMSITESTSENASAHSTSDVINRTEDVSSTDFTANTSSVPQNILSGGINNNVPEQSETLTENQEETDRNRLLTCTFSISCETILHNMDKLDQKKIGIIPSDGWIQRPITVTFSEGESVFDVLKRACRENGIHLEFSWTPLNRAAYIEGIYNLYEFDCGSLSGWMYSVNGEIFNYSCSSYTLKNGDVVAWQYTCKNGADLGGRSVSG